MQGTSAGCSTECLHCSPSRCASLQRCRTRSSHPASPLPLCLQVPALPGRLLRGGRLAAGRVPLEDDAGAQRRAARTPEQHVGVLEVRRGGGGVRWVRLAAGLQLAPAVPAICSCGSASPAAWRVGAPTPTYPPAPTAWACLSSCCWLRSWGRSPSGWSTTVGGRPGGGQQGWSRSLGWAEPEVRQALEPCRGIQQLPSASRLTCLALPRASCRAGIAHNDQVPPRDVWSWVQARAGGREAWAGSACRRPPVPAVIPCSSPTPALHPPSSSSAGGAGRHRVHFGPRRQQMGRRARGHGPPPALGAELSGHWQRGGALD